jgi:tartrate dehydrogenase/decarboxylase/D-malate dehydrogenase
MRRHKIAAVPGNGIGPEVFDAGLEGLKAVAEADGGNRLETER